MTDTITEPGIVEAMPLLAKNEGVWEGWYRYYDARTGKLVDEHRSRLICRLISDENGERYHQTNHYFWPDGRTEVRDFPADYRDGRIWWDNDLIKGWCAAMQPDDARRTSCLYWERKNEPGLYLYEMIQNNADYTTRHRTWQWFQDGECYQRTLIDEKLVTRDWQNFTGDAAPQD